MDSIGPENRNEFHQDTVIEEQARDQGAAERKAKLGKNRNIM